MKYSLLFIPCFFMCSSYLKPEGPSFDEILSKKKELIFSDSCTGG